MADRPLRVLSLGAGVQSTTVLLQALAGEIEPLDCAVFADTGWEPAEVYDHLTLLEAEAAAHGLPVYRVSAGNIRDDHVAPEGQHLFIRNPRTRPEQLGKQRTFMPFYVLTPKGGYRYRGDESDGPAEKGKTRRTCTKTYKIEPVERKLRDLLGLVPRQRWPLQHAITQVFGISYDETERMHDPDRPAIVNDYPLVDLKMTCSARTAQGSAAPSRS